MQQNDALRPAQVKRLVLALIGGIVVVSIVVFVVTGGFSADAPPWWVGVALPLLVVAGAAVVSWRWAHPEAIDPNDPTPDETAAGRLVQHLAFAFAVLEFPVILAIILAFVLDAGGWPIAYAAIPAAAAMAFSLWPTRNNIDRFARALESLGARTHLREVFAA